MRGTENPEISDRYGREALFSGYGGIGVDEPVLGTGVREDVGVRVPLAGLFAPVG